MVTLWQVMTTTPRTSLYVLGLFNTPPPSFGAHDRGVNDVTSGMRFQKASVLSILPRDAAMALHSLFWKEQRGVGRVLHFDRRAGRGIFLARYVFEGVSEVAQNYGT